MKLTDFTGGKCCWPLEDRFCCAVPAPGRAFCPQHAEAAFRMRHDEKPDFDSRLDRILALAGAAVAGRA